jgi:hypothetical protein
MDEPPLTDAERFSTVMKTEDLIKIQEKNEANRK